MTLYRLLAVLGAMWLAAILGALPWLLVALMRAPRGWQDGDGFHAGNRRTRK